MFETPILFLIFNRPQSTEKAFDAIQKLKPKYLFIAADGPRINNNNDIENCNLTRSIVFNNINWDCEVKTLLRTKNLGCGAAVRSALCWFFKNVEQGIIVEDDIIAEPNFFTFCEEMLQSHKNDKDILSISGFNFGYENNINFTSRFMNMWGWATWRRAAISIDYDLNIWKKKTNFHKTLFLLIKLHTHYRIDVSWLNLWKNIFNDLVTDSKLQKIDTWDYQWIFHGLNTNKKIIFSKYNYIKNIGFNEQGTHTLNNNNLITSLITTNDVPNKLTDFNISLNFEEKYLKHVWMGMTNNQNINLFKYIYITIIKRLKNT